MDAIIKRFRAEAKDRVISIETLAEGLIDAAGVVDPTVAYDAIREQAHMLKGAAGVLDFPDIKNAAASLEDLVASGLDNVDTDAAGALLEAAVSALGSAIEAAG